MQERQYLKKSIRLRGESDGAPFWRTFVIIKRIDEGTFSVCYEACHDQIYRGVLKEFYPRELGPLTRDARGQLVMDTVQKDNLGEQTPETFLKESLGEEARQRFLMAEEEYIAPYRSLAAAMQADGQEVLATFIPKYEIYHGCDDKGAIIGTTYIWTPYPVLWTFEKVCEDIHRHPTLSPERKLVTVLMAIDTLAGCVCALHAAGFVHRDIKPSNFGFLHRENEPLPQTLSLFDINSLCPVSGRTEGVMYTPGYSEPEAVYDRVSNQTDIYSIGACLFHAMIVTDDVREAGYLYNPACFGRLRELVKESALIKASEANSHPRLRNALTTILERCLCEREKRYESCEALREDLQTALYYALPAGLVKKGRAGDRWVLADIEKSLDTHKDKNSRLALQYHLYHHPLYRCCPAGEALRVLIIGFGNYGQKFLDACLAAGQMRDRRLSVTVVSDEATDKEIYLADRPELKDFFDIDGSLPEGEAAYGRVRFETRLLLVGNRRANVHALREFVGGQSSQSHPHYVFIALGDDGMNRVAARTVSAVLRRTSLISYVLENEDPSAVDPAAFLCPVYVNRRIKGSSVHSDIERMAFNTHLVWEKNLNIDHKAVSTDFRKAYNHDACISSVLSLKYKLYSVGIDLDQCAFDRAASDYSHLMADEHYATWRDELIWVEHRRWVTEKIRQGWRRIKNLEECAGGLTRDEKNKRHVCILRSRPGGHLAEERVTQGDQGLRDAAADDGLHQIGPSSQPDGRLTEERVAKADYSWWDTATAEELAQLDDLDRMSVALHRLYAARAEKVREYNLLADYSLAAIRKLTEDDSRGATAFREWFSCLRDIWNGDREKVHLYKGVKEGFMEAVSGLHKVQQKAIGDQVRAVETMFYPVMAAMEYRDWKEVNAAIVDAIPFILTYTEKAHLVIPFGTGTNTALFENVAAAAVINPSVITFLYNIEESQDICALTQGLMAVIRYLDRKHMQASLELVLLGGIGRGSFSAEDGTDGKLLSDQFMGGTDGDSFSAEDGTDGKLPSDQFMAGAVKAVLELGSVRIRRVKPMKDTGAKDLAAQLTDYLRQRSRGKGFFALEKKAGKLSDYLETAGLYQAFPSYAFDSSHGAFYAMRGCAMPGYIRKKPYLSVADLAAFRPLALGKQRMTGFLEDYRALWEKYSEDRQLWRGLCQSLKDHAENQDILAVFSREDKKEKSSDVQTYRYILPAESHDSVKKILAALTEFNILEPESRVAWYTTEACELVIADACRLRERYDRLFSETCALIQPEAVRVVTDRREGVVRVSFDDLAVKGFTVPCDREAPYRRLIEYFRDLGYVINLSDSEGTLHFTYATRQVKALLTSPEKMLEIYICHKVREAGWFDDVSGGFETEAEKPFDCILTKGFQSIFIACGVLPENGQVYLDRLEALAQEQGINATAVVIDDTSQGAQQPKEAALCADGAVVIRAPDEIRDIARTLLKVIERG